MVRRRTLASRISIEVSREATALISRYRTRVDCLLGKRSCQKPDQARALTRLGLISCMVVRLIFGLQRRYIPPLLAITLIPSRFIVRS
jgi:hypothetical protein